MRDGERILDHLRAKGVQWKHHRTHFQAVPKAKMLKELAEADWRK
jgi:hypothetical protein